MEEQSTNLSNGVIILQDPLIQDHIISDISGMDAIITEEFILEFQTTPKK
jgi:hypothetical protein